MSGIFSVIPYTIDTHHFVGVLVRHVDLETARRMAEAVWQTFPDCYGVIK
jgi:hypothetical protein